MDFNIGGLIVAAVLFAICIGTAPKVFNPKIRWVRILGFIVGGPFAGWLGVLWIGILIAGQKVPGF